MQVVPVMAFGVTLVLPGERAESIGEAGRNGKARVVDARAARREICILMSFPMCSLRRLLREQTDTRNM